MCDYIKKAVLLFLAFVLLNNATIGNDKNDKLKWWKEAKFGMFIHWGLYAVPAGIYKGKETDQIGEWIMFNENIPVEEYEKFTNDFNPVKFNVSEWVSSAKEAGMKYIVITSKHHDGFCLWDSKVSDYDIVDRTPYKKDILKQLSDECSKQGIKLCFYYSIWDWHHPKANEEEFDEYYRNYMVPQIKELLTEYGDIGIMWFDGEWIDEWTEEKGVELYNYILSLQPNTIVNNRVGKGRSGMEGLTEDKFFAADYDTPEQEIPATKLGNRSWETCMTMNDTWGYKLNDDNWKTSYDLIFKLVDIVSKGGNFLLNVGPKADGTFPEESVERLSTISKWMKINSEAIYSTKPYRKFNEGKFIRYTSSLDDNYLYAIISNYDGSAVVLNEINIKDNSKIRLLGYSNELAYTIDSGKLKIECPKQFSADTTVNKFRVLKIEQKKYVSIPAIRIIEEDGNNIKVEVDNNGNSVKVRYSLDGNTLSTNSKEFNSTLSFDETTILKVKAFKEGYASSLTVTKIIDIPKLCINGVKYKYYEGSNWNKLPNFSTTEIVSQGHINNFDIKNIKKREDLFAIEFKSFLKIPITGIYNFYLDSDDGSKLIIDEKVIIDNDGSHSRIRKNNSVYLGKGFHEIELQYFEDSEGEYLELSFDSEVISKQEIPSSFLFLSKEKVD